MDSLILIGLYLSESEDILLYRLGMSVYEAQIIVDEFYVRMFSEDS